MNNYLRFFLVLIVVATFFGGPVWYQIFHRIDPATLAASFTLSFLVGAFLLVLLLIRQKGPGGRSRFYFKDQGFHKWQNIPLDSENIGLISVKDPEGLFREIGPGDVAIRAIPLAILLAVILGWILLGLLRHDIEYGQIVERSSMGQAIDLASRIVEARMKLKAPDDWKKVKEMTEEEIVVVRGAYDRVETILSLNGIKHRVVNPAGVAGLQPNPRGIMMINCPGNLPREAIAWVRDFVDKGGHLLTTDWAIRGTVQQAFPGYISHNGMKTRDECIDVEVPRRDIPETSLMLSASGNPHWWLFYSFPVKVDDPEKVSLLVTSEQMKERYGTNLVAASFRYGAGRVIHIAAHFFQNRSEIRSERHAGPATAFIENELGVPLSKLDEETRNMAEASKVAPVENAYSIHQFIINSLVARKRP